MWMRREARHDGQAQLLQVARETGHLVVVDSGVDEQRAVPALHDDGVALHEPALVDQHAIGDRLQHGTGPPSDVACNRMSRR